MPSFFQRFTGFIRRIGARASSAVARLRGSSVRALPAPARQLAGPQERAASKVRGGKSVINNLPLWAQFQRIGGSLTPDDVANILREADVGYLYRYIDLCNESRQKDCHLQSVLATRELAIAGLQWQIVPGGPRSKDKRAAQWCETQLRAILTFPAFIAHLAGGCYYGHAVAETLWKKDSGKLVPYELKPISPRRFIYDQTSGEMHFWDLLGSVSYPGVNLRREHPGQFIEYHPRINGDVEVREGLGRVLLWAALFRNWDLRDWLSLGELAWKPWRIGTYQKGASDEDIDNLEDVLENLTTSGVATIPETTQLKIEAAAGTSGTKGQHETLFNVLGQEISKAVVGQTLTTEQGRAGSYALGDVHDRVRRDIREADAISIAAVLRRDLLSWMIAFNFKDAAVPHFQFLTDEAIDLKAFGDALKSMRDAGMPIQVSWVRDRAGIPAPIDGEPMLGDEAEESTPPPPVAEDDPEPDESGDAAETPEPGTVEPEETPAPPSSAGKKE